jgi:predicted GNAT family acetyltransferase
VEIKHNKEHQRFYLFQDGKESYVHYILQGDKIINLIRTYVPPELRHRGMAGLIVKAVFEYARENNLKVIPTCPYVNHFISNNNEFEDLLV